MKKNSGHRATIWKTQLPVDYIDTTLTINTPENVVADLSGGIPARLWYWKVEQTNNGTTAETISMAVTINGTVYTVSRACDSGTVYALSVLQNLSTGDFELFLAADDRTVGANAAGLAVPFTAETVSLITVQQTTSVDGTSAKIEVNIVWDKLTAVQV